MTHLNGKSPIKLVLASQSPARLSTLEAAGITPSVTVSKVDENQIIAAYPQDSYPEMVMALAKAKALEVYERQEIEDCPQPTIVVGADSMLEIEGQLVGKPHTKEEAKKRWETMRGNHGTLHTGHCVVVNPAARKLATDTEATQLPVSSHLEREETPTSIRITASESTEVHFGQPTQTDLEAYLATEEPLYVAGAFTVDGLGGAFIDRIEGDYHSVVGLSLPLLRRILNHEGLAWTSLWNH